MEQMIEAHRGAIQGAAQIVRTNGPLTKGQQDLYNQTRARAQTPRGNVSYGSRPTEEQA